jgi:transcriptional regulator with XRE-family HTH domain
MDIKEVAKLVRHANKSEIARRTGIHLSHVSRVLNGKRTASSQNLADISAELGCTMDELHACLTQIRNKVLRQIAAA